MSDQVIEKMDGIVKDIQEMRQGSETNKKAMDDITKRLEDAQNDRLKIESVEKQIGEIDKKLGRLGNGVAVNNESKLLAEREAMCKYLRYGDSIEEETNEGIIKSLLGTKSVGVRKEILDREVKSVLVGSNPDGGYLLRPEYSNTMITRLFETSPMRSVANVMTSSSGSMEFIIDDNEAASGGWVGEIDIRSETATPQVGQKTIYVQEQFANAKITQRALDDISLDVEQWLQTKIIDKFTRVENTAFVLGNDVKSPRGFLTYPNGADYTRGSLEQINSGVSAEITADGLKDVQNSLYEGYQSNAVWMMHRESFGEVAKLKDQYGRYLLDVNSLKLGDTMTLLGKPVIFASDMPLPAADSLSVAYGDFREGYTILDGVGVRVLRDPYTDKGKVNYYVTKRVGGDVTNYQSIKLLKLSA